MSLSGGNDRCYKNLDDDGFSFSLAIRPLRGASKRKASGFAGGYLLSPDHPMRTSEALFPVTEWSEQAERLDRKKHFSYKNKKGLTEIG